MSPHAANPSPEAPDAPEAPAAVTGPGADAIEEWLAQRLAERLSLAVDELDVTEPLASYGLSSTEAVTLSGDLERWLGRELPTTLVWDYPTIESLSRNLGSPRPGAAVRHGEDPSR